MAINKRKGATPPAKAKPQRRCVGCREMKDKKDLLRIVRLADLAEVNSDAANSIKFVLDESGKAAGRGAYVCKAEGCLGSAVKNKGFERSFKAKLPQTVYEEILCIIKNCLT